jgi:hypothetical protein
MKCVVLALMLLGLLASGDDSPTAERDTPSSLSIAPTTDWLRVGQTGLQGSGYLEVDLRTVARAASGLRPTTGSGRPSWNSRLSTLTRRSRGNRVSSDDARARLRFTDLHSSRRRLANAISGFVVNSGTSVPAGGSS